MPTITFRKPELFEQFADVIKVGLDLVDIHSQMFPTRDAKKIIFLPNGTLKIETIHIPNLKKFVSNYEKEILSLPEFMLFDKTIIADPEFSNHFYRTMGTFLDRHDFSPADLISFSLSEVLENDIESSSKVVEKVSRDIYSDLERFVYSRELPIVDIVPLDNFDSDIQSQELCEGMLLRKITTKEKEFLLENSRLGQFRIMSLKHVVEFTYSAEKIHSIQFVDVVNDNLMPHFIDELRLFKKGLVGYSLIVGRVNLLLPPIGSSVVSSIHYTTTSSLIKCSIPKLGG